MTAPSIAPARDRVTWRPSSLQVLTVGLVLVLVGRPVMAGLFDSPALRTWATVFVAICVQALPSVHAEPSALFGFEHTPVPVSHVPAL